MNKICKLSAIALLATSTNLMAQSKSFEGVSVGLSASAIGLEVSGSGSTAAGASGSGSIGKVAEIAAIDLSYGYALGPNGIFQIGASYTPGKAKAGSTKFTDTAGDPSVTNSGTVSLQVKDPYTIYLAPTYVVSKDAAMYFKLGYSKADINTSTTGTVSLSRKPGDLEGWTYAVGSKIMLTPNAYFGVEASITDYDSVSATTAAVSGGTDGGKTITADPKAVQAIVTLGYRF
jgi:hypothetical protein